MAGNFHLGPWLVEPGLNSVSRSDLYAHLSPKVMAVLVCLAEHAGDAVSKEILFETVWPDTFVGDDVLKGYISDLRRVLEDDARDPRIIQTIPKSGYRLVAPVEWTKGTESSTYALEKDHASAGNHRKLRMAALAVIFAAVLFLIVLSNVGRVRTWLTSSATAPQIHSLAVLPLRSLSSDPNQEYFSDGLTDALITNLAQISSLKVISRTSIMHYKKADKTLPDVARELNVDGIIEGTVQRSGDRVRITAQLIHGPSDKHLWANSYERDLRDVFALEHEVAADVAHEVRARLTSENQLHPVNPATLEAYLRGNSHMHKFERGFGDEELRLASQFFSQAIQAEPDFAPAYVGLARAHRTFQSSTDDLQGARKAAERAVELDPNLSDAWTALADIRCNFWEWAGAEQGYRRALALNPNDALAHERLGWMLDAFGRMDEGWKEAEIAQQLDPNEERLEPALDHRHEYDQIIQHITTMLQADPDNAILHHQLYEGYAGKGMYKEAIEQLEQTFALLGFPDRAGKLREAFTASGFRGAMWKYAEELERLHATSQAFAPINVATAYTVAGDKDRAFYWLEQAYKYRGRSSIGYWMITINREPLLEPLHSDPRFIDLLRRVGLPL